MHKVRSIKQRRILNSHLALTNEFEIELDDGAVGIGSSSQGETISVYEADSTGSGPRDISNDIRHDVFFAEPVGQEDFDHFLDERIGRYGRNNCWALSQAFFNATDSPPSKNWNGGAPEQFPRLCLNVLNGGAHAYTNPVLSDFPEYLIVPKFDDIREVIHDHARIQNEVRNGLASCERVTVNSNVVHRLRNRDNRECVSFLQRVLDQLGLIDRYDIMIDASAGDLWSNDRYRFSLTDGASRSTAELREYWQGLIDEYGLGLLEDPFREYDHDGWSALTLGQRGCKIIGDNLYSSDPGRIEKGSQEGLTHGVIIKPNQAGTVTAVRKAVTTAHRSGQIPITSHRSISTESTFLSLLTIMEKVRYVKIGPLYTDYSSTMRLNELIRLTGVDLA